MEEIYLLIYYPVVGLHILGAYKDIGHAEQARCDELERRMEKMRCALDSNPLRTEEEKEQTFNRWLNELDDYLYIRSIDLK